ncbi:haloacid dehalogenase-like hydrolase domain-containing protein 1A [Histoplasma capsulatum]|uniref:Haloacid dehalogenase-like hydrolase domain-containing protein 1A n=1 Tax=Ajellomyces capsulatus TaxID=5037 RepID=A0A8A1ME93_AJECA|nr:haloacid dehalogenase-like hydrolase domain-containing protein 1A [Histoplasma capsulatum]
MEDFREKQAALQKIHFPTTKPLPGVVSLLSTLAKTAQTPCPIHMALATSSTSENYALKAAHLADLFSVFPESRLIRGDNPRIGAGRGKPLPDIYLLALEAVNEEIRAANNGEPEIKPEECLVFEDSVSGVEAGRRAGMQVVWVPYSGLLEEYRGKEELVLAGLTGEHKDVDVEHAVLEGLEGLDTWRGRGSGKTGEIRDTHCVIEGKVVVVLALLMASSSNQERSGDSYGHITGKFSDSDHVPIGGSMDDVRIRTWQLKKDQFHSSCHCAVYTGAVNNTPNQQLKRQFDEWNDWL